MMSFTQAQSKLSIQLFFQGTVWEVKCVGHLPAYLFLLWAVPVARGSLRVAVFWQ